MAKRIFQKGARCTYKIAAELLYISERSAARYISRMRNDLGFSKYERVTIEEFCEYYNIWNVELLN